MPLLGRRGFLGSALFGSITCITSLAYYGQQHAKQASMVAPQPSQVFESVTRAPIASLHVCYVNGTIENTASFDTAQLEQCVVPARFYSSVRTPWSELHPLLLLFLLLASAVMVALVHLTVRSATKARRLYRAIDRRSVLGIYCLYCENFILGMQLASTTSGALLGFLSMFSQASSALAEAAACSPFTLLLATVIASWRTFATALEQRTHDIAKELSAKKATIVELSLEASSYETQQHLAAVTMSLDEHDDEIAAAEVAIRDLKQDLEEHIVTHSEDTCIMEGTIQRKMEENEELERQLKEANAAKESTSRALEDMGTQLEEKENLVGTMTISQTSLNASIHKLENDFQEAVTQVQNLKAQVEQNKQENDMLSTKNEDLEHRLRDLDNEHKEKSAGYELVVSEQKKAVVAAQESSALCKTLQLEAENSRKALACANYKIENLESKYEESTKALDIVQQKLDTLEAELQKSTSALKEALSDDEYQRMREHLFERTTCTLLLETYTRNIELERQLEAGEKETIESEKRDKTSCPVTSGYTPPIPLALQDAAQGFPGASDEDLKKRPSEPLQSTTSKPTKSPAPEPQSAVCSSNTASVTQSANVALKSTSSRPGKQLPRSHGVSKKPRVQPSHPTTQPIAFEMSTPRFDFNMQPSRGTVGPEENSVSNQKAQAMSFGSSTQTFDFNLQPATNSAQPEDSSALVAQPTTLRKRQVQKSDPKAQTMPSELSTQSLNSDVQTSKESTKPEEGSGSVAQRTIPTNVPDFDAASGKGDDMFGPMPLSISERLKAATSMSQAQTPIPRPTPTPDPTSTSTSPHLSLTNNDNTSTRKCYANGNTAVKKKTECNGDNGNPCIGNPDLYDPEGSLINPQNYVRRYGGRDKKDERNQRTKAQDRLNLCFQCFRAREDARASTGGGNGA